MKADDFIKKAACRRIEWNLKEVQECRASLWRRKEEEEVTDKRVLVLIRKFLKSGVMINGVVVDTEAGCPQGGPLSPLLANIMLNELDREPEERGLKFCRYADDCNIEEYH